MSRFVDRVDRRRRRRPRCAPGLSLVEVSVAMTVMGLLLTTALGISGSVTRAADKNGVETRLTGDAREALDEVLYQVRGASSVLPSRALGGLTYTTNAAGTTVVLSAPGYDPASTTVLLPGVTDYVAFQYDSQAKTVVETLVPGAGSKRPARNRYLLAEKVEGFRCTFRARDVFTPGTGSVALVLRAPMASGASPIVYVNGVQTAATAVTALSVTTVTVPVTAAGSEVQVVYDVNPTTYATATAALSEDVKPALEAVVELRFADQDSRRNVRTVTLHGAARLRNRRG